ncbi:MAG: Formate dehydrogenase putative subunit protein [Myxococcales bacterium]|nr:Formate dehydrogenase putative subunit protein [Myxococcales bacterium]
MIGMEKHPTGDGRNLDPARADEHGEGALIDVRVPDIAWPIAPEAHPAPARVPSETYYDLPVIKAPPWRWFVPAYFHMGGMAGAASSLAAAVQLSRRNTALERKLHWISLIGEASGGLLLIADLGRPGRFFNMLRVFRPTSPMNMGTWILSAAGTTTGLSLLASLRGRKSRPSVVGVIGAVAGTALSTYTGVLLGNTAVPVWKSTRRHLPPWFAALSAASLASVLELGGADAPLVRRYSIVAKSAALVAGRAVARAADRDGVGAPLRDSGLALASRWLGIASLVATAWPGASRRRTRIAGALGTAAALLARFAIVQAGRASASDPRATFAPQRRERSDAHEARRTRP